MGIGVLTVSCVAAGKIEKQEATQSNMKSYWDLETELRKQIVSRDMPGQMEKTAVAESDDLSRE